MGRFIGKQGRNLLAKPQETEGRNLLAEKADVVKSDLVIPPRRAGFKDFAIGGAPGFGVTPGAEDVLPMVGQTLGGKYGPMAAGGAAVGEIARQGIRTIRGDRSGVKEPMSLGLGAIGLPRAIPSVGRETVGTLAAEGVMRGLGKVTKPVTNRLMIAAMRPAKDVLKRSPNIGSDAAELGLFGSAKTIGKKADKIISETTPKVENILQGKRQRVNALRIASELDSLKNPYDKAMNTAIQETQDTILRGADQNGLIDVATANKEKQMIYRALKDSSWGKGMGEVPALATVRKNAAHGFKGEIEGAVPEVSPLNKKLSTAFGASEGVDKQLAKAWYKPFIPFVEGIGAVGGLATGNPWLTAAILMRRAMQSPAFLSRSAQAISNKPLGRATTLGMAEISRRMSNSNS